jgi:hypothetical protein
MNTQLPVPKTQRERLPELTLGVAELLRAVRAARESSTPLQVPLSAPSSLRALFQAEKELQDSQQPERRLRGRLTHWLPRWQRFH